MAAPTLTLTGTYAGTIVGSAYGRTFTMQTTFAVEQNDTQISGTFTTTAGTSGTVSGTLAGTAIADFLARQTAPCLGLLRGSATILDGGAKLSGSYSGNDCRGSINATFELTRYGQ
jgi:hypothetical protein